MMGIKLMPHINMILLFSVVGIALVLLASSTLFSTYFSTHFTLPSILLILKEVILILSFFMPGYLLQFVVTSKLFSVTLSKEERIACSFALSLLLISILSFITSFTGVGLRETFYSYFIASSVILVIVLLLNRNWIFHKLSSLFKVSRLHLNSLLLFSLLFLVFPLFHVFGFAKLNWDGFNFYLRDALAIDIANSIPAYYPNSFYDGNIPLIFNSYLSTIVYSYALNVLNIMDFDGSVPLLMEYTNVSLSFIILATLLVTTLLLKSFTHQIFKDKYLVAATVIIFLTAPLLNQYLYSWSLYADIFFAFATLLVLVFSYRYLKIDDRGSRYFSLRYLKIDDRGSRYFSLLMIVIGLSLAITTKTYGYLLLLIVPLICLKGLKDFAFSNFRLKTKEPVFANYFPRMIVLALFAVLIGFASLYTIRDVMLIGSPFGYSVKALVNYSDNERWADNIIDSSGIHQWIKNYPAVNQNTALLLSYGLFPLFIVPLLIGIFLLIKKEFWGLGIIVIYILFYYIMFITVLQMRVDRHLLSLIPLLSPVYVYGLKSFAGSLGWSGKGILCMTILLLLLQLPLHDAFYEDFEVANFFPTMFYWYTTDNLVLVLGYSLLTFGIVASLDKGIVSVIAKQHREWYIFGTLFGITVLAVIFWPTINILDKYASYEDYISISYQEKHFSYPVALQEFLEINGNNSSNNKLLYLHGMGTEFLTKAHASYIKIDDFRMLANMKDVIEEKNAHKVHELLLSKDIKYILYPSERNLHYYTKLEVLSEFTDNALIFGDPSSVTTKKISLNDWWDLYIV